MKFFADTAEISEIRELAETGLLDGVTTNPSLIHKSGRDLLEMINDILDIAKLEAGKMEVRLSEFRIDSVIAKNTTVIGTSKINEALVLFQYFDNNITADDNHRPGIQTPDFFFGANTNTVDGPTRRQLTTSPPAAASKVSNRLGSRVCSRRRGQRPRSA